MRAHVDRDTCIGCGLCSDNCPEVFEQVDGRSSVKVDPVPESAYDCAREAAENCPVSAITIEE